MKREYGYNWSRPKAMLWALPFVFYYVLWRESRIGPLEVGIIILAVVWSNVAAFWAICKVVINDTSIETRFLLPLWRGGRFSHGDVERYSPLALQRKDRSIPVGGILKIRGQRPMMILPTGVEHFEELNTVLSAMFPKEDKEQTTEPTGRAYVAPAAGAPSAHP